ncbi:hypothetical protein Hanom_Chr12g01122941 [Helianthus anomalus]
MVVVVFRERDKCCLLAEVKKQTIFFLQTVGVWSTSSATDVCRCGPPNADVLPLKNSTLHTLLQHSNWS